VPSAPPGLPTPRNRRPQRPRRPKIKKLRLALILAGLSLLALVSTVFGMMMAVSQDLPAIEDFQQYRTSQNSELFDTTGKKLGMLTGNKNRILVSSDEISQNMKQAVVAVEDRRFYQHNGVDFQGIGRAFLSDIFRGSRQGASTITEQFVKNALEAQSSRTVFEKLREAALAYHLEKKWTKDKILTTYLNTVYFGEGAYGIEAAARTYFGAFHPGCGDDGQPKCASLLLPEEAAMLAGIIASPSAYDPRLHPEAAQQRRNFVLERMYQQGLLASADFHDAQAKALPAPSQIEPPREQSLSPYFTSWLRQQIVDRYGAGRAFAGGLRIRTTLDLAVQQEAEAAIQRHLAGIAPTGSAVVIDNRTGAVRALVGGFDFQHRPFNLATNGHRQPGSTFKPFTLITALEKGRSPNEVFTSQPKTFKVPHSPHEHFVVHNYNDAYAGSRTLTAATTYSDNSVYAELGLQLGTKAIARTAKLMGIETKVSTNPAMILGALKEGVTPLEMAYAYTTIAHNGQRVSGSLAADGYDRGPVAIEDVKDNHDNVLKVNGHPQVNKPSFTQVIPPSVDHTAISVLGTVIASGTGRRAGIGDFAWGKTGTTENNGDAWFCGANKDITACVWVGHADSTQPMETEFGGQPVDGGTFPAEIWHDIVVGYENIKAERDLARKNAAVQRKAAAAATSAPPVLPAAPAPVTPVRPAPQTGQAAPPQQQPAPSGGGTAGGGAAAGGGTGTGA
jgi:penicillin-binding protein 1A